LIKYGFKDVYKLQDGIVNYMEKYPNEGFKGKLYVFDRRVVIGFNTEDPQHEIVGKCDLCKATSENLIDYRGEDNVRKYGIVCETCLEANKVRPD